MTGILDGIRVLDATGGLAGPYATRLLAEAGADVIRLEPAGGDPLRATSPAAFTTLNRSKASAVLPDGAEARGLLEELLARCDVLVHGLTPSDARAAGLDDQRLADRHPHLIVASVGGFPPGHPDEEFAAEELLVQARMGAMDEQRGYHPGPVAIRLPFANWGAAFLLAGGIVARLYQRLKHEIAAPIHTSLAQGLLVGQCLIWQRAERAPQWMLDHTLPKANSVPSLTLFQCADGRWIHLLGGFRESPPVLEILAVIGKMHLTEAWPLTADLARQWAPVFLRRTADDWLERLRASDVPCSPVLGVGDVLREEQSIVNGYSVEVEDPVFGRSLQTGAPFTLQPPPSVRGAAPGIGAHTAAVLRLAQQAAPKRTRGASPPDAAGLPLAGLRVLDLGMYVSSPFGAQCLADLGADVIKLEPPSGDPARRINQWTGCQRGKRSIAVDLRSPESREILTRLVRWADIVSHNVRLEAARRLGIDDASLKAVNPNVILSHVSAFGEAGPWAGLPGYDPIAQALSGWEVGIAGEGNPPMYVRNSLMDPFTGLGSFVATMLALYHRERSGEANMATTSLLAVAAALSGETLVTLPERDVVPIAVIDPQQRVIAPGHGVYQTADGWIAIAATTPGKVVALRSVLGVGDDSEIAGETAVRSCDDLVPVLRDAGVPAEPVRFNQRDAFFDAELVRETRLVVRTESFDWGWLDTPGSYWTLPGQSLQFDRSVPGLGQHTHEILQALGFTDNEMAGLAESGVVVGLSQATGNAQTR